METTPQPGPDAEREAVEHDVKCWPPFFAAVLDESKPFEVRLDDRDYRAGDDIRLREFLPDSGFFTGRHTLRRITFCLRGGSFGIHAGHVVLGLATLTTRAKRAEVEIAAIVNTLDRHGIACPGAHLTGEPWTLPQRVEIACLAACDETAEAEIARLREHSVYSETAAGALQAIHELLDNGGIPRGTFADDHVRNLVALYNQRGDELARLREALNWIAQPDVDPTLTGTGAVTARHMQWVARAALSSEPQAAADGERG